MIKTLVMSNRNSGKIEYFSGSMNASFVSRGPRSHLAVTEGTIVETLRFISFSWWVQLGVYILLWLVFFIVTVLHVFLTCGKLAR